MCEILKIHKFFAAEQNILNPKISSESASYRLEGGWIGDFYESLQNMEVLKTNDRNKPITMQRKVDYTRQAIVKYSMKWKHNDLIAAM